jgi:hypothetical protein
VGAWITLAEMRRHEIQRAAEQALALWPDGDATLQDVVDDGLRVLVSCGWRARLRAMGGPHGELCGAPFALSVTARPRAPAQAFTWAKTPRLG